MEVSTFFTQTLPAGETQFALVPKFSSSVSCQHSKKMDHCLCQLNLTKDRFFKANHVVLATRDNLGKYLGVVKCLHTDRVTTSYGILPATYIVVWCTKDLPTSLVSE